MGHIYSGGGKKNRKKNLTPSGLFSENQHRNGEPYEPHAQGYQGLFERMLQAIYEDCHRKCGGLTRQSAKTDAKIW